MKVVPEHWKRVGPTWMVGAAAASLGASVVVGSLARSMGLEAESLGLYGAALVEAGFFAAGVILVLLWLQPALDELEEWIRLKAYRLGFLVSALGLYAYGILVDAGLPATDFRAIALLMLFVFCLSAVLVSRRYS